MSIDWDGMAGEKATETVLRAAVSAKACEVHLSSDYEGAAIFFVSDSGIEFFNHIPPTCRGKLCAHLKGIAGVDTWQKPPANGYGYFTLSDYTCQFEVSTIKGLVDEDMIIRLDSK